MKLSSRTIILFETLCLLGFIAARANPSENNDEIRACPDGLQRVHRGCYMFVEDELNWQDAANYCKENNGELSTIQSFNEKEELQKYVNANYPDTGKWWIGLTKNKTLQNEWTWLDGHPLDGNVLPWLNSLQKIKPGIVCGYADSASKRLLAAVVTCKTEQSFICEYHSITPRPSTDITTALKSEGIFGTTLSEDTTTIGVTPTSISQGSINSETTMWSTTNPQTSSLATSPKDIHTTYQESTKLPVTQSVSSSQYISDTTTSKKEATSHITRTTLTTEAEKVDITSSQPRINGDGDSTTERAETTTESTSLPTQPVTTAPDTTRPTTAYTTQPVTTAQDTTRPTISYTTQPARTSPETPLPTLVDWVKALEDFEGCYIPGTGGSIRDTVMSARNFYTESLTTCPEVKIGSILWPAVKAGNTTKAKCTKGDGFATFECGIERRCWKGQPDITGCASKKLQFLLKTVEISNTEITVAPPTIEQSIELSSQLAQATESEDTTMEDIMVTSQVLTAMTQKTEGGEVKDKEQVQAIVDNVVKTGSNLVSSNKSAMWDEMSQDDKVRSASTLLVAMETATVSMAQEINEPTVITQKNENIELELRVVDMSALEKEDKKELVYGSSNSDNSFSIPIETLKSFSKGGLAKTVFMTHYSMSDILGGRSKRQTTRPVTKIRDPHLSESETSEKKNGSKAEMDEIGEETERNDEEDETGPRIASYILSASIGSEGQITKLLHPISFTMKHVVEIDAKYTALCSFWNVSQSGHQGFWSQDGCHVMKTNRSHTTCSCDHLTNFAILLNVHDFQTSKVHQSLLNLVTIIGCVISCVSLLASWVTFQCFVGSQPNSNTEQSGYLLRHSDFNEGEIEFLVISETDDKTSLQGERNSIHKNLALTLLAAELLFVAGIEQTEHKILCSVIAGFLHFFFLAAFTWMFIEGLHIIFMLVQVFDSSRSRLPYYYLTGYGVPFVVVGVSCLFYYKGYGTDDYCWLTTERYFIWAFAGPVALILLVNAFFLTYAMSTVCRHAEYVFSSKDKATGSGIRTWVQGALALEVLLGLTWTLGYFLMNDNSLPLAYIFSIMNSLQGLFIFVFHCLLNKKAQKEYRLMANSVVKRSPSNATTHSTLTKRTHNTNHSHDHNHSPSHSQQKLNVNNGHSMA